MKTTTMIAILWICALLLTACGGTNRSTNSLRNGTGGARLLTPEAKLALGVLKLEGTPQAIDAAGAAKLLPLWQLLAQLNGSSSSAPQEVTAVLDAIHASMTPGQVQALDGMQLTSADVGAVFQQLGSSSRTSGAGGTPSSGSGSTNRGAGGGGFFFGGGGGAPGAGIPGAGGGFRTAGGAGGSATPAAGSSTSTTPSFTNALSITLVDQVIQLLKSKLAA